MIIKGVKKAAGEFNSWQGAARIYLDCSDGTVWTKIYTSPGWWNEYYSQSIIEVYDKATCSMWERDNTISMKELRAICENKISELKKLGSNYYESSYLYSC